eukprot:m.148955 g.148955  ORF g.148955 m.148955 type:complete len:512 (-) comp16148_c0_seq3:417-1952(-)
MTTLISLKSAALEDTSPFLDSTLALHSAAEHKHTSLLIESSGGMETVTFTSIAVADFAQVLRHGESSETLVIDVRSFRKYTEAHIIGALTVRLSKLLMRRLAAGRISVDDVISDQDNKWKNRSSSCFVVCYDDHATDETVIYDPQDPLHLVLRSLTSNGINAVFLSGGYSVFAASEEALIEVSPSPRKSSCPGAIGLVPHLAGLSVKLVPPASDMASHCDGNTFAANLGNHAGSQSLRASFSCSTPCPTNLLTPVVASSTCATSNAHNNHVHHGHCNGNSNFATNPNTHSGFGGLMHGDSLRSLTLPAPPMSMPMRSLSSFCATEQVLQPPQRRPLVARAAPFFMAATTPRTATASSSNAVLDAQMSCVRPFLFIGARRDASDKNLLEKHGITCILNVTKDCENYFETDSVYEYLQIPILDTWNQRLQEYFPVVFSFIDAARHAGKKVLVHCQAGVSRSAAMVIGYLMYSEQMTLDEAHQAVRLQRDIISPNLDFMGELKEYEVTLQRSCT